MMTRGRQGGEGAVSSLVLYRYFPLLRYKVQYLLTRYRKSSCSTSHLCFREEKNRRGGREGGRTSQRSASQSGPSSTLKLRWCCAEAHPIHFTDTYTAYGGRSAARTAPSNPHWTPGHAESDDTFRPGLRILSVWGTGRKWEMSRQLACGNSVSSKDWERPSCLAIAWLRSVARSRCFPAHWLPGPVGVGLGRLDR